MPAVSVIVPVFNVRKYLPTTIESICGQTLKDIEIIFVDDGSTDGSASVIEKYSKKDSRIMLLKQKNSGAGVARNFGLSVATGEYLSILDSDDFYEPTMLEIAYGVAAAKRCDMAVFGSNRYFDKTNSFVETPWAVKKNMLPGKSVFSIHDVKSCVFRAIQGWTWDKLFKRSFIKSNDIRFQTIKIYNDMYFTFAAYVNAGRITYIDKTLVHQRKRGGGSLSDNASKSWSCVFDALGALHEAIEGTGDEALLREYDNYEIAMLLRQLSISSDKDSAAMTEAILSRGYVQKVLSKTSGYYFDKSEVAAIRLLEKWHSIN